MSMTKQDELRIIEAVRNGQTDRFEDLVRVHEKGIYNFCLRMLGSEQDALDASQEAFFKAYRALDGFRGESRFSTWLYRLAGNVRLDILRKRPAVPALSLDDDGSGLSQTLRDPAPSPQDFLEKNDLRHAVDKALSGLPEEFRQAVVLRDVNGLSYEEIAAVTGLESGTVKSRIFRGRKKLAGALLSDGNFTELYPSISMKKTRKGGGEA